MSVMFGNRELDVQDVIRLGVIAAPARGPADIPDTLFLRFGRDSYSRAEVLELLQLVARMQPDECDMEGDELRLWWD